MTPIMSRVSGSQASTATNVVEAGCLQPVLAARRCGLKFDGSCWCVWQEGAACRRNSAGSLRGAFFLYAPVRGEAGRWQMTRTCWGTCGSAGSPLVSPWTRTSSPRERPNLTMWVSPTAFSRQVRSRQHRLASYHSGFHCIPVRDKAPDVQLQTISVLLPAVLCLSSFNIYMFA